MRVGLLIYGSLDTLSGGYLYDRKLVETLRSQGDSVEIYSLPWRSYLRSLGDNFSDELLRRLANAGLDVLLQDELNHPSLFRLNHRLRRKIRYPLVSIVHHLRSSELRPAWQNRLYAWVERRYLRSVDGFIFNSQTTRRTTLQLQADLARLPGVIAYPAGDRFDVQSFLPQQISRLLPAEIEQRARQPGPLRLLFLGNLIPRKGLHTLLTALARLDRSTWRLTAAGSLNMDAAYTRAIQRQIGAAGLQDHIRLTGPLNDDALASEIAASHVLVVPSSYEGFGIVYLEGMSFGLPAIATTAGAAGEIITSGKDGYLIAPGDAQALAECIARLAEDRQHLLVLSLAARQRFLAHPTWQQSMLRIREFLLGLDLK